MLSVCKADSVCVLVGMAHPGTYDQASLKKKGAGHSLGSLFNCLLLFQFYHLGVVALDSPLQ
jgi:hypothetical protein